MPCLLFLCEKMGGNERKGDGGGEKRRWRRRKGDEEKRRKGDREKEKEEERKGDGEKTRWREKEMEREKGRGRAAYRTAVSQGVKLALDVVPVSLPDGQTERHRGAGLTAEVYSMVTFPTFLFVQVTFIFLYLINGMP